MEGWLEEQFHALLSIDTAGCFFSEILSHARQIGFDYCAYGLRSPIPITKPSIEVMNNYPMWWWEKYQKANYISIDPTVRHGIVSPLPLVWSDKLFSNSPELWEEAKSAGLRFGWALSIRSHNGVVGMLTLARDNESLSDAELSAKLARMIWLSQVSYVGMVKHLGGRLIPALAVELTPREKEVLKWTADGKTSIEIAEILRISERTVNFHVANVVRKLQAANKNAAAARAVMLGLI